ncbi:hypothetical protein [Marinibactrum halimedae]|uniref:Endo-beta-1,6-galactanase-like domain-containing protein n=1 Tax=Marinibactrum halimedae TaxID=1444977 RepID=A0AA37T5I6_9GAMM|nr:hypothetical protein [Marinibactrum halimedae]MCD9458382.1 hypothetical protein [Marinibactrum halimedae]GLS26079.1 hypothetical protein GCM10007877_17940 [Marinibactrum halimedae]
MKSLFSVQYGKRVAVASLISMLSSQVAAIDVRFNTRDAGVVKQSEMWTVGTSNVRESSEYVGNTIDAMRFGAVQEYALQADGTLSDEAKAEIDGYVEKLDQLNRLNFQNDPDNYKEIRTVTLMASSAKDKVHPYYVSANGNNINTGRWRNMFKAYVRYVEDVHNLTVRFIEPGNETDFGDKYKNKENWRKIHRVFNEDDTLSNYPIVGPSTLSAGAVHNWWPYVQNNTDWAATHVINGTMKNYIRFLKQSKQEGKPYFASENHSLAEMIICANYADCIGGLWWRTSADKGDWSRVSKTGRQLAYVEDRPNWTVATVYKQRRARKIWLFASGGTRATSNNAQPTTYTFISEDRDVYFDGIGPQRQFEIEVQKDATYAIEVTWE